MSPETPATSLSQSRIGNLMQTLRRANAYHSQLAAASRASFHPARKARRHARALHLSISVEAASALDHRQISAIPLPVLDLGPSPPPDVDIAFHVSDVTTTPEIVAPIPRYPSQVQIGNNTLAQEIERPVLRCAIPSRTIITVPEDIVSSVPGQSVLASQWSASTTGSGETEEGDDEEDTTEPDIPQPPHIGVRYPHSDDNENMDILVSPDDDDDDQENGETFAPIHTQSSLHLPPVVIQVPPENNQMHTLRPPLPTRLPQQAAPVRQQQEQPQAAEAGHGNCSSGSGSSRSSLELVTPITSEGLPVSMTRIKRKSLLEDVDMDGEDYDYYMVVEKRPKYERQVSNERRAHHRTNSWFRRNV